MSAALLTADWFLLGRDLYFRKFEIYTMGWKQEVNLDNVVCAAAPYGGPIAVRRDEKKLLKVQGTAQLIIGIYSGSGKHVASVKWTRRPVVKMGWSNDESFVCVQDDGHVVLHDLFGNFKHSFLINEEVQDTKVIDAKIFTSRQNTTGVAVMTSNYKIFLVNNVLEPKTRQLSKLPDSSKPPTSWDVISEDNQTDVLIAREMELYRLKQDEHQTTTMLEPDIKIKYTSILDISVSINARHVVLFTNSGHLWLGSSDLRKKYCEIDADTVYKPKQLVWCGTEAVIAYWEQDYRMLIVGRSGNKFNYIYDGSVHLVSEIDCVRVLSSVQHELVQKVPDVVQKIFRINSTEPGSFLLEASKQFQKRSHKADEYISLLKDDLNKAVEQCIEAAGFEFDVDVQKMLIRAAQFGKCYITNFDCTDYVQMCRLLRVLNAVRHRRIGIPLTFTELHHQSLGVLLDRLVRRGHYELAFPIARYLKIKDEDGCSRILVHWAKYKVSKPNQEEEVVAKQISQKLGFNPKISYSEIATAAVNTGRKKLAIYLMEYETKASEQVALLMKLGKKYSALEKAIESGDMDLVHMVILDLRDKMPLGEFKITIRKQSVAHALYIKHCRMHNLQALNELYIQEDDNNSQALGHILEAFDEKKKHNQDASVAMALEAFKKARNDLCSSVCEDTISLLKQQRTFETKYSAVFSGKSIHDTCKQLLDLGDLKAADKIKSDFKIPDRRYWWLRIQSLADNEDWRELDKFSKVKKSPVGYAPFVDVCLKKHNQAEAANYLPKVNEEIKVKYYVKAEKFEEAAQIAFEQRDLQGLLYVQSKCSSQAQLTDKINGLISQLGTRK